MPDESKPDQDRARRTAQEQLPGLPHCTEEEHRLAAQLRKNHPGISDERIEDLFETS